MFEGYTLFNAHVKPDGQAMLDVPDEDFIFLCNEAASKLRIPD